MNPALVVILVIGAVCLLGLFLRRSRAGEGADDTLYKAKPEGPASLRPAVQKMVKYIDADAVTRDAHYWALGKPTVTCADPSFCVSLNAFCGRPFVFPAADYTVRELSALESAVLRLGKRQQDARDAKKKAEAEQALRAIAAAPDPQPQKPAVTPDGIGSP